MDQQKTCNGCAMWQRSASATSAIQHGECRIVAPTLATRAAGEQPWGDWPLTRPTDWCGQWRSAAAEA